MTSPFRLAVILLSLRCVAAAPNPGVALASERQSEEPIAENEIAEIKDVANTSAGKCQQLSEDGDWSLVATKIPPRPAGAMTGSEFANKTRGWKGAARQRAAVDELIRGNLPAFLRTLHPVTMKHRLSDGRQVDAMIWVSCDYLSIGSEADFLRIPLTRPSAVAVAAQFDCVLPTRRIVDAINDQAEFRFTPQPLPPRREMRSSEYYARHNALLEEQRRGRPLGELLAGHKKDVVLTNRLLGPERIAIYGWHKRDGKPIQPLSTVHGADYADYSHGVRLVYGSICIDGKEHSLLDVLADPKLAPIVTHEGVIPRIRNLMRR